MDSQNKKKRPLPSWMKAISVREKCNKIDTKECYRTSVNSDGIRGDIVEPLGEINGSLNLQVKDSPALSASDVIEKSMPFLSFQGSVLYSCHKSDAIGLCHDILSLLSDDKITPVGFDMEWPVTFKTGASNKTALIQLCLDNTCFLFHLSAMISIPKSLINLILDKRILLVGLNIDCDLWKLARDFDINVKPIIDDKRAVDIGRLANDKLKSSEKWSLEGLCRNLIRKRLDKSPSVRCGDWSNFPLDKEQQIYAATDAFASLLLYQKLI